MRFVAFNHSTARHPALAVLMALVLLISSTLSVAHDHWLEHEHQANCAICKFDSTPHLSDNTGICAFVPFAIDNPVAASIPLLLIEREKREPRGPPIAL